jgi:hypothetical protein
MVYFLLVSVHLNNISKVLNFFFHNYVDLLKPPTQRFFGQNLAKNEKILIKKRNILWQYILIFSENNCQFLRKTTLIMYSDPEI